MSQQINPFFLRHQFTSFRSKRRPNYSFRQHLYHMSNSVFGVYGEKHLLGHELPVVTGANFKSHDH